VISPDGSGILFLLRHEAEKDTADSRKQLLNPSPKGELAKQIHQIVFQKVSFLNNSQILQIIVFNKK
jgi:hypothetical protein